MTENEKPVGLTIVVPAYNEEDLLVGAVENLLETVPRWVDDLEIIIVNDGSNDGTGRQADELMAKHAAVKAVHQTPNRGFGGTFREGILQATKPYVMYSPADHFLTSQELDMFLVLIKYSDIVITYRRIRRMELPFFNWVVSSGYHALVITLFRLNFYDVNWIHMYHRDQISQFLGKSDGVFFLAENLIRATRNKLKVVGVDVDYVERQMGTATGVKFGTIFKTFHELFSFYFKSRRK